LVNNAISSISFSPSGSTIACLSQNGDVFLWDVETSTSDQILEGHAVASNVVYSPDGKYLASGDLSGRVIIWHSDTGNVMKTLYGVESPVASIDYSLDSSTLAVGYEDGSISLWDVFAGKIISTFSGHSSSIVHLLFSPDGKTIASSGNDRNILWEVSSGEILYFGEHGGSHLAFSPDGKLLGLNCGGEIWLVDLSTYEEIQFHEVSLDTETFKFSAPLIVGIVFGKNSEVIAAETDVGTKLILFDILTKEEIINVEFTMDGSAQYAIDYSPVDNMFAVADGIGNVYIYGASTGSEIELFDAVHKVEGRGPSVRRLTFSPDGKQIATCLDNGIIVIWNLDQ